MYPIRTRALLVSQPLGTYFLTKLPARVLLDVAFSDVMGAESAGDGMGYSLVGTQRPTQEKRLGQIAAYIDRSDSAFPNAIILAANHDPSTGYDEEEARTLDIEDIDAVASGSEDGVVDRQWSVARVDDSVWELIIPTGKKLAAIIDGQHRLFAFTKCADPSRLDMELACAIYLDLPKPYQAQLFATINSTQKAVDKSLTYELFGYNVEEEAPSLWTPDKLAVFITRRLGTLPESPLRGCILVAPKRDEVLEELHQESSWGVSTAVIVDGVLRLISSNPKADANQMRTPLGLGRTALREFRRDRSPLRQEFIDGNDALIYKLTLNYLSACDQVFWQHAGEDSYIKKTVGVQALFDILRRIAAKAVGQKDIRVEFFQEQLAGARNLDFAAERFRVPAGKGRTAIRSAIEEAVGLGATK